MNNMEIVTMAVSLTSLVVAAFAIYLSIQFFKMSSKVSEDTKEAANDIKAKPRDFQYAHLLNSQVKVLKKGFVSRRRQIQRGIRSLKEDEEKVGLLLQGTGGLEKSCLAGKFCDQFKDHALIIVHGKLTAFKFKLLETKRGILRFDSISHLFCCKNCLR